MLRKLHMHLWSGRYALDAFESDWKIRVIKDKYAGLSIEGMQLEKCELEIDHNTLKEKAKFKISSRIWHIAVSVSTLDNTV